jgi:hypothetical protein
MYEHCITVGKRYYGLRRQDIKRLAFQLAIRNGLKRPFNQEKSAARKKWLRSFLKRHPVLPTRTPERNICSSGESLYIKKATFFDIYESELREVNHQAHRIFNVNVTGITTVQHRHRKVVSMRVKKEVSSVNIGRKRKSYYCCHLYECHWNIPSPLIAFPRKKNMRGAYGRSTDGLNFGLTFKWLDSD